MEIFAYILMVPITLAIYAFVMSSLFPKHLLKISYDVSPIMGRGLKKFVYPEGRAVLYEAQPDIRKYVERYALFTLEGYKYLQLTIGSGVKSYTASIVMLNNKNRVLDVISLSETTSGALRSRPTRIHGETSYVAISMTSVNGVELDSPAFAMTRLREILVYFIATALLSLLVIFEMFFTVNEIFDALELEAASFNTLILVLPALLIALLSLTIHLVARAKNGIKVVLK